MSARFWPRAFAASAAIAIIGSLSACSPTETAPVGERGAELAVQFAGVPLSLNPALGGSAGSAVFTNLAYDPLIHLAGDGSLVPDLATEWTFVDEENTVFEMTIREGVTFSQGGELTAEAVKASIDYFLTAGGPQLAAAGPIESVTAVDADTVQVTYATPFPNAAFSFNQYQGVGLVIGPDGLANPESLLTTTDGAGQYTYNRDESVADSTYIYDRNEGYWNPEAQQYERVSVSVIGDPSATLSAITTGQVDFAGGNPNTAAAAEEAGLEVVTAPFFNWGLNVVDREGTTNPALGDERVRQALALAIDRDAVAAAVGEKFSAANGQIANAGIPGYIEGEGFEFDLDAAKALLADAGYADGFTLTILSEAILDGQSTIVQAMTSHFAEIGVVVDLKVIPDVPGFIGEASSGNYGVISWPYVGVSSAEVALNFTNPGFSNVFGVTDADLADLQLEALTAPEADRVGVYEDITKRMKELAWFLPAVSTLSTYYVSPSVTNVQLSAINPNPLPVGPAPEYAWQPAAE